MNSERLIFRQYTAADFDDYFQFVSNTDVMKLIIGRPLFESETRKLFEVMLKTNLEYPEIGHFKLPLRSGGSFVKHSKLELTDGKEAEIGYISMPEYWRRVLLMK